MVPEVNSQTSVALNSRSYLSMPAARLIFGRSCQLLFLCHPQRARLILLASCGWTSLLGPQHARSTILNIPLIEGKMYKIMAVGTTLLLAGCSTHLQQLRLNRDQLIRLEAAATTARQKAEAGQFDPSRYDLYLHLNRSVFDTITSSFDGMVVEVDADGRPIDFTVSSIRMNFRPGHPGVTVTANARDRRSGIEAGVDMDARLLIERDSVGARSLYMRVVATRIVPRVSWGPLHFTRNWFVRRLLALEATQFTEGLPRVSIPVTSKFAVGGPAGEQNITLPTGEGTVTGRIRFPATQQQRNVVVKEILSLRNGVHLFADVEPLP